MNIKSLNLTENFSTNTFEPLPFKLNRFSGGEWNILLSDAWRYVSIDKIIISMRMNSSDDIIKALLTKDAVNRFGVNNIELHIPYLPYARQDRVCNEGESFSLMVFASIINNAGFSKVKFLDVHSGTSELLINNHHSLNNSIYVYKAMNDIHSNINLIIPDLGASKKIDTIATHSKISKIIQCNKKRNQLTRELSGFEVYHGDLNNEDCIIVDDICDGGRTFIGIAKELKKKNAGDIYLFVTHGIFSYGFEELSKYFKKIYCTNSFRYINNPIVTQYEIVI